MANLVPHDQYQNSVKLQLGRLEAMKPRVIVLLNARLAIFLVASLGMFVVFYTVIKDMWPAFMEAKEGGEVFVHSGILVLLFWVCTQGAHVVPSWFIWDSMFPKRNLKCPHCAGLVDVYSEFRCGFCSHKTSNRPIHQARTAIDPCNTKVTQEGKRQKCGHSASALMCPHCKNDVVLNLTAYNSAPQLDFGFEGTVTELLPGKE